MWDNEIAKEIKNVKISFDIMGDGERVPNGYKQFHCHMIFDVSMEYFRRKARLLDDGYMAKTPKFQTYYSIVLRETVRFALTISDLNDLQVKAGEVMNVYVTAPITKKILNVL